MLLKTIQIIGDDADQFLQGLLTVDINRLNTCRLLSAACNRQGRVIANFWIWQENSKFYLQLPEKMAFLLIQHFKKYVFRSKVLFTFHEKMTACLSSDIVWILPKTSELFLPQMIGLEKQRGVDFKKGCYLGQEVIARAEHLGRIKRHLYQASLLKQKKDILTVGDHIQDDRGQKKGDVVFVRCPLIGAVIEDRAIKHRLFCKGQLLESVKYFTFS